MNPLSDFTHWKFPWQLWTILMVVSFIGTGVDSHMLGAIRFGLSDLVPVLLSPIRTPAIPPEKLPAQSNCGFTTKCPRLSI
jgi:hypothetical protein